jgi:hypothetical protein
MVMRVLRLLDMDHDTVRLRMDSTSAISWGEKFRAKSERGSNAGLAFVEHAMASLCTGYQFVHQAGKLHVLADSRSRKGTLADLGEAWKDVPEVDLRAEGLVALCDPARCHLTVEALSEDLGALRREVESVVRGGALSARGRGL